MMDWEKDISEGRTTDRYEFVASLLISKNLILKPYVFSNVCVLLLLVKLGLASTYSYASL